MSPVGITVLISGNVGSSGTNLQAIMDAIKDGKIQDAEIVRVISNRLKAFGLQRARDAGIPTVYHNLKSFSKQHPELTNDDQIRKGYDKALADLILEHRPKRSLVVCAGWMHVLSLDFLDPLERSSVPIINLHPALPNAFNGIDAIERAYLAFQKGLITKTGVMVHCVISDVDAGKPLVIKELDIAKDETCAQLEQRIHSLEWLAIVEGVQLAITSI
ncbi:MAG: hypothetical protein Q9210_003620 [Variospora velana]